MGRAVRPTGTGGIGLAAEDFVRAIASGITSRRGWTSRHPARPPPPPGGARGRSPRRPPEWTTRSAGRRSHRTMLVSGCSNATRGGFKRPRPNSFRRGEPRERGAPVMRRRGLEPPPGYPGPGPQPLTRVSYPSYASRSSDASADLDGMDDLDAATASLPDAAVRSRYAGTRSAFARSRRPRSSAVASSWRGSSGARTGPVVSPMSAHAVLTAAE
jgi:hypothetical protein